MPTINKDQLAAYRRALETFEEKLELQCVGETPFGDGGKLNSYVWPSSNNGTKRDRAIVVIINRDGSWTEYMSTDRGSIHETIINLQLMARAT